MLSRIHTPLREYHSQTKSSVSIVLLKEMPAKAANTAVARATTLKNNLRDSEEKLRPVPRTSLGKITLLACIKGMETDVIHVEIL